MLTLEFQKREPADTLHKVRSENNVPAVFYGPKEDSTPISIKQADFKKVWKEAGESSIIILKNGTEEHEALIKEIDLHPVSGVVRHADFYVIEKGKKLQVTVQLEFIGISEMVKSGAGSLTKVLHEVEVEAMPKDLPHDLEVDISSLTTLDSQILASDIKLPAGVELITNPEEVVAAISAARDETEEEVVVALDPSKIELSVEKGKADEEEGAGDKE
ncbi:MAG: 50S ribosomal protein L25 [Patescibacteria group bacterium]